ncbi:MAG: TylF/MycF/NovP-related O-methyltransferase [Xanthobacteraceae bacterium]
MSIVRVLKRMVQNSDALVAGAENQQQLLNDRLREVVAGIANQSRLLNDKLEALTVEFANQSRLLNDKLEALTGYNGSHPSIDELMRRLPPSAAVPKQAARIVDRVLQEYVRPFHESMSWGDRLLTLDKSAGFREDATFLAALREADSSTGQNQYESPDGIVWRYNTLIWAARACLAVSGDYVECGVYRGDMTWMITQNVDVASVGKTFFLYDTFSGFDPRYSSTDDFPDAPNLYALADNEYSAPNIEEFVRQRFRDKPHIVVTAGTVPDVLHERSPDRIAFLHLDMNSPRAETEALKVLFNRVSTGGIIIFDDYGWKVFHRQKEAADAFMAASGQVILELPTGQGLMIKR